MTTRKVIVVGGGPAGASTAFFLAQAGLDVTVIDRARFPRDKPCSEYMSPEASRILHEMGALAAVEAAGADQLVGMRLQSPDGTTVQGEFVGQHRYRGFRDRGLAIPRTILDAILLDRARTAGVKVEERARVSDIVRDASGRVRGVTLSNGKPGHTIEADLIIGADGLRSIVGRRLGLITMSRWPRRIALVSHYRGVGDMGPYGEMFVTCNGYYGVVSVGNGITNFAIVVPVSRAAEIAGDRTEFMENWIADHPAITERFRNAERVGPVKATGPFASRARRAWVPGAALVGDAADFFDPFTGEGIYAALRGGEILAHRIIEAADAADPRRMDAQLRRYDAARKREFSGKWKVERLIGATIGLTPLINRSAKVLAKRQDMADLLVGVGGDFVPTGEVLNPRFLMRLFLLPTG
ncbi:MAG TPA: NAD(P)/FAD-dependent oxidoreductase [Gemmatimonadaceae bacterium]|jgi:flavin-dependent dehydrogenase